MLRMSDLYNKYTPLPTYYHHSAAKRSYRRMQHRFEIIWYVSLGGKSFIRKLRWFSGILSQMLAKFVFQLSHFVLNSFAKIIYNTTFGVTKWERDLWMFSRFFERVKWSEREFDHFLIEIPPWFNPQINQFCILMKLRYIFMLALQV